MPAATTPPANQCGDNSETPALATEFQALRKEFDALRAGIDSNYNPRSYATAGLHNQRGKKTRKGGQAAAAGGYICTYIYIFYLYYYQFC